MERMSPLAVRCLYLIIIGLCVLIQNGLALRVEAVPDSFDATSDKELNISCIVEEASILSSSIVTIEITRKNQRAIVMLREGVIYTGNGMKPHMQTDSNMEQGVGPRFLRLTIRNPGVEDAGTYVCRMFYLDESVAMTEVKALRNVTLTKLEPVVTYLMDKVSAMEKIIERQGNIISQQGRQLENQQERIQEQESKNAFDVAFYAEYDPKDKIVAGHKLIFSKKLVDIGNAFNFSSGIFTAPKPGLYLFYFSGTIRQKNAWIFIDLKAGYHLRGAVSAHTDKTWDQSSMTVLLKLEAGEQVWTDIRLLQNTDILTHGFSAFGGHLVKLL